MDTPRTFICNHPAKPHNTHRHVRVLTPGSTSFNGPKHFAVAVRCPSSAGVHLAALKYANAHHTTLLGTRTQANPQKSKTMALARILLYTATDGLVD